MTKDLTASSIDRQNILNNPYALEEIQKSIGLQGIKFNGQLVLLKEQVANFFAVTPRTIENYLAQNDSELRQNGYRVQFLLLNGYMYCAGRFIREMENISYHLAAGKIDKELLHDIIDAIIDQSLDENEALKLRILHAIQDVSN